MSNALLNQGNRVSQDRGTSTDPSSVLSEDVITERNARYSNAYNNDSKTKEELEVEEAAWSSDDSLASAQRFFSSAALGWGDEMGLWTAAAAASVATGTPISEVYADMRKTYDAKQDAFKERQPGAALAADIAGSVASPVNALKVAQAATKLGRGAQTVGRVATEGAVYGAGEAKEGERLSGAATGAGGGLLAYGALRGAAKGVGTGVNALTSRKVAKPLVNEAGEFIPLTLAAEGDGVVETTIQRFYKGVISPISGSMKRQEEAIIRSPEELKEGLTKFAKQVDEGLKLAEDKAAADVKLASDALQETGEELKRIRTKQRDGTIAPLSEKLEAIKKTKANQYVARATQQATQNQNARRSVFRDQAFASAMPAKASADDIQRIGSIEDIGQRIRALDKMWAKDGYSMIKGKKIRVPANQFAKDISEGILEDPVFKVLAPDIGSSFKKNVLKTLESVDKFRDKSGRIDGDALATIRSSLGTWASASSDYQLSRAYRMVQSKLDDVIKKQLTGDQLKAFNKESGNWKSTVVLRDAVESTRNSAVKRGEFDETDWIKAAGKNSKYDKRYGTGPLVAQARTLESSLGTASKALAKRATNLAKAQANMIEKEIASHNNALKKSLKETEENIVKKKKQLAYSPEAQEELATLMMKENKLQQEINVVDAELKKLSNMRGPQNPSWFHGLAALGLLGGSVLSGTLAPLAAAAGVGATLATKPVQKAIAGQTATQEALQKLLKADATGATTDILSRSLGRVGGGGMFTQ
ncbi:MAG: hypothetical protein P8J32_02275 [bacterium]|nr:hypothetical protein [bacterium]